MDTITQNVWNKGKLLGQKRPLKLKDVWGIRIRLQLAGRTRDLALFNLAIDSKLRGCDLVRLQVRDITHAGVISSRAIILQRKTHLPVQFEITEQTRKAVGAWIRQEGLSGGQYLFPSRVTGSPPLSTRQYGRLVRSWVSDVGLEPSEYGTHSLRRTKANTWST